MTLTHTAGKRPENRAFPSLKRGRKENDVNDTFTGSTQLRSPCIISIIPVRCKVSPLRPGWEG